MKSLYLYFTLVVLIALYGCQTTPENYNLPEPLSSQGQTNSGAIQGREKPPAAIPASENRLFESEADSAIKAGASQNSTTGTSIEKKQFGGWEVVCNPIGTDCTAILRVKRKAGKQFFALMVKSVYKEGPDAKTLVTAWLPLGFSLPDPAKIYIGDQNEPFQLFAQYCTAQGCLVASNAPDSIVSALKQNPGGKVTISMIQFTSNKQIKFSFTQSGFPEAYQYMLKKQ